MSDETRRTALIVLAEAKQCVVAAEKHRNRVYERIADLIRAADAESHGKNAPPGLTPEMIGKRRASKDLVVDSAKKDNAWQMAQATMYASLASALLQNEILKEVRAISHATREVRGR